MHIECVAVCNESEPNGLIENESMKLPHVCVCVWLFAKLSPHKTEHVYCSIPSLCFCLHFPNRSGNAFTFNNYQTCLLVINRSICKIYPILNERIEVQSTAQTIIATINHTHMQ